MLIATKFNHKTCIEIILKYCQSSNIRLDVELAIRIAIEESNVAALRLLVKFDNAKFKSHMVVHALRSKNYEFADFVIQTGRVNIVQELSATRTKEKWDFILSHATEGEGYLITSLAHDLASANEWSCLMYLLKGKFCGLVDLNYVDINNDKYETVLTMAIKKNKVFVVEELLQHDIDLNQPNAKDETPMDCAINEYEEEQSVRGWNIVLSLVGHGCNITMDKERLMMGSPDVVQLLLLVGVVVDRTNLKWWELEFLTRAENDNEIQCGITRPPSLKHLFDLA